MNATCTNVKPTTMPWLMARGRDGVRRIEKLSWGRLNRIYQARTTTSQIRSAIRLEARRCGYKPDLILHLNRWE